MGVSSSLNNNRESQYIKLPKLVDETTVRVRGIMKEFWVRENGDIAETEKNPCRCCPDTYDFTTKMRGLKDKIHTGHIGYMPRRKFMKVMKQMGYEKLK